MEDKTKRWIHRATHQWSEQFFAQTGTTGSGSSFPKLPSCRDVLGGHQGLEMAKSEVLQNSKPKQAKPISRLILHQTTISIAISILCDTDDNEVIPVEHALMKGAFYRCQTSSPLFQQTSEPVFRNISNNHQQTIDFLSLLEKTSHPPTTRKSNNLLTNPPQKTWVLRFLLKKASGLFGMRLALESHQGHRQRCPPGVTLLKQNLSMNCAEDP